MDNRNNNISFMDALTMFSVMLQVQNYQSDLKAASNDDLMEELQKQDKAYLEKIIENQNRILEKLAELG